MMSPSLPAETALIIENYLRAKDGHLPHLLTRVFCEDARFTPVYRDDGPFGGGKRATGRTRRGLDEIISGFRSLGEHCENIVTVVPVESLRLDHDTLESEWAVAMTNRHGRTGFCGWGRYRWTLNDARDRARTLEVRFDGMTELSGGNQRAVLDALLSLAHPWCPRRQLEAHAERLPALAPLAGWLAAA